MKLTGIIVSIIVVLALGGAAWAAPAVVDAYYRPDVVVPGYDKFCKVASEGEVGSTGSGLGGTVQVYIRNTSDKALAVEDAALEGVSLKQGIAYSDQRKFRKRAFAASIYFSKLPKEQVDKLKAAGEPVWWRFEPKTLAPGQVGELIVRLRHKPSSDTLSVRIPAGDGAAEASVKIGAAVPRMEGICFGYGRDQVYLYLKHPKAGTPPNRIYLDGEDVTSHATIACDANTVTVPVVLALKAPLALGSFHCFQAAYASGERVTAGVRAFDDEFAFGVWGAQPGKSGDTAAARAYFQDLAAHNVNVQMEQIGSGMILEYMKSAEGRKQMADLGIRRMIAQAGKGGTKYPWAYFLMDEPDAGDSKVEGLPSQSRVGALAQGVVDRGFELRQESPETPLLLNVDYTYRPDNWYTYGQTADILTSDPYYQVRLSEEVRSGKNASGSPFSQATYINGVTSICRSSQAPRQLNMVLYLGTPGKEGKPFRFGTPQEKRIESYYAVGSGAKGLSYWWFASLADGLKPGKEDPIAAAAWHELGLIGAEFRTAGPVIMTSCPAGIPATAPKDLWTQTLLRGKDTIVLLCVNDAYSNDAEGTHIKPIEGVDVELEMPSWLKTASVFEIDCMGSHSVDWKADGNKLKIGLGKVEVSRMVFITSDQGLRQRLQDAYTSRYASSVAKLGGPLPVRTP